MTVTLKISFDDACKLDLRVVDLLVKYGVKNAICYVPSDWQTYNLGDGREPLSVQDVLDISDQFEIGSHSVTHRMLTRCELDIAEWEIVESKLALEKFLGKEVNSFCYPRGYANDDIKELVRKHYKTARNTLVGSIVEPTDPIWETPTVHISGTRRKEYEGTTWMHQAKRWWDIVQEHGGIYHAWLHSWEINRYNDWDDFESFLKMVT